jgi:hypothetical protein
MKAQAHCNQSFDFYFRELDTAVVVEDLEDAIVIRASRDSFSERRKQNFIRELAAEGFIPDGLNVRWLVAALPGTPPKDVAARTNRFMIRLFVCSVLLWMGLMGTAILCAN